VSKNKGERSKISFIKKAPGERKKIFPGNFKEWQRE